MTAPVDCLVSIEVLFSDYTSSFFPSFYPFLTDNFNYGSLFRECIFSLFTRIYSKINISDVQTISSRQ